MLRAGPAEVALRVLDAPDAPARLRITRELQPAERAQLAEHLKAEAERHLLVDCERSLKVAQIMRELAPNNGIGVLAQADALRNLGRFAEARAAYDAAARLFDASNDDIGWARSRTGATYTCRHTGADPRVLQDTERARQIFADHGLWLRLARLESAIGYLFSELGRTTEALAAFDRALQAASRLETPDEPLEAEILGNQAIAHYHLANYKEAEALRNRATSIFERYGLTEWIGQSQSIYARYLAAVGHYSRALASVRPARRAYQHVGQLAAAAEVGQVGVECLIRLNRAREAADLAADVADEFEQTGSRVEAAVTLVWRSLALSRLGQMQLALKTLDRAEALYGSADWETGPIAVRLGRAAVLESAHDWAAALAEADAVRRVLRQRGRVGLLAQVELVRARALRALGDPDAARQTAEAILELVQERGLPWVAYHAWRQIGEIARASGNSDEALTAFGHATTALEQVQGRILTEYRTTFLADKLGVYEHAVDLLCMRGDFEAAFEYAERAKSRALVDALAGGLDIRVRATTDRERTLVAELSDLRREHDQLFQRDAAAPELQGYERRIASVLEELRLAGTADLERVSLLQGRVYSPRPLLDEHTLLLEYYATRDDLVIFGVDGEGIRAERIVGGVAEVRRLQALLQLNLDAAAAADAPGRDRLTPNAVAILGRMYELLVAPARAWLAGRQRLIVVPHGLLHQIPFAALHDGQAYLIESLEVVVAPSASSLVFCCRPRSAPTGRVLVLGHSAAGSLPGVLEEARGLARLFETEALLEDEASIANLQARAAGCDVIHVAAHGLSRLDAPLFSHVQLADGQLSALDCFELELDGALVTLSACESGRGWVAPGDEPIGLPRALLYAGARAVLQSLWRVDDRATRDLMEAFYTALRAGHGAGAALRRAQIEFIDKAPGHPFLWAALVLIGDWRA